MKSLFLLILMITTSLPTTCSAAQTTTTTTATSNNFASLRDQNQYFTNNQQQQQQVLALQQQNQAQQRQSAQPTNSQPRLTSLPNILPQSPEQNTFAPAAWRGLSAATARGTIPTATTIQSSTPTVDLHGVSSSVNAVPRQQQPKSLKFTLIAGKYWKFNVKTNSLQSSHKERELRLHRNISVNSFIIDDDSWFQYNHQQQQLFAWPSLSTPASTYYFVLLPSSLDFEADGENVINSGDVIASIVVELIPPLFIGARGSDVDQFVDHKFSLEYLHRHQSYPLLLSQVVSVFEILAKINATTTTTVTNSQSPNQGLTSHNTSNLLAALQQNKQSRSLKPLNEYLLIQSSATSDGEFFSLTWTTHPSLVNNTIAPIEDCRLSTINDTVSKLSARSILYPTVDDKFIISYALEGPLTNAQTIIPTERGNYALRLNLSGPCRRRNILEELGIASIPGPYLGLPSDSDSTDQRDNTSPETQLPQSQSTIRSLITNKSSTILPSDNNQKIATITSAQNTPLTPNFAERDEEEPNELITAQPTKSDLFINNSSLEAQKSSNYSSTSRSVDAILNQSELNHTNLESPPTIPSKDSTAQDKTSAISPAIAVVSYSSSTERVATDDGATSPSISPSEPTLVDSTTVATNKAAPRAQLIDKNTPVPHQTSGEPILGRHPQQNLFENQQLQQPSKYQHIPKSLANFIGSEPDVRSVNHNTMSKPDIAPYNTTYSVTNISHFTNPISSTTQANNDVANSSNSVLTIPISTTRATTIGPIADAQESSLNEDLIGILNEVMEYLVSIAVPIAIVVGSLLLISILIALCNLCMKKKKSQQFKVGDRFKVRYGSERRQFLKNSCKPVVLEADQKSLSIGGTPQHRQLNLYVQGQANRAEYQKMTPLKSNDITLTDAQMTTSFAAGSRNAGQNSK